MSTNIHPTAIVDPLAQLGSDVTVGPYAIIEAAAVIGDRCTIQAHAVISGRVVMGADNLIGYGAIIGAEPQDLAFRPEVESEVQIGEGNRIREYCTIHRGTSSGSVTMVGNHCFLMAGAHLAHNVRLGDRVILANNTLLAGYVTVEDRVFVGGGCAFHQHIRVGRLAICRGGSAFSKNIPPFVTAGGHNRVIGLNSIGLRRANLPPTARVEIKAAFALLYRGGLNVAQALAAAKERTWSEEGQAFWEFVATAGPRGLCAASQAKRGDEDE